MVGCLGVIYGDRPGIVTIEHFHNRPLQVDVVVLKGFILHEFTLGRCGGHERTNFCVIVTLGRCGGPERAALYNFYFLGCDSLESTDLEKKVNSGGFGGFHRTDFLQFLFWENAVVLKGLMFDAFHFGRVLWF